jgi:cyclophilin family peptidyl-prolyl cis-trans isomerase
MLAVVATAKAGTIVQLSTAYGNMKFELYDTDKPITVANFLSYITSGRYEDSFAHRLADNFVLQGGGYKIVGDNVETVTTFGPIVNEFATGTVYSNTKGTIAMAKLGGDPNSATSQWFINLGNNGGTPPFGLDYQNEGFTVFGRIIEGLDVLQDFLDFTPWAGGTANNVIVDASGGVSGSPFGEVPVRSMNSSNIDLDNLVYTQWSIVPVPEPSTYALLGIGFVFGIIAFRRSRTA